LTIQDYAAWAAALGTFLATVLTALNLRREAQWRREDERQRSENEKREQAARITAWILTDQKLGQTKKDIIRISNQSFSPVYHCVATFVINEQNGQHYPADYRRKLTTLPPGECRRAPRHPKGGAGDERAPRRRDCLHRRTRSTLGTKRCGTVAREPDRCDQALRSRNALFFRSTDPSNHIDPPEYIFATGKSMRCESGLVRSKHKPPTDV